MKTKTVFDDENNPISIVDYNKYVSDINIGIGDGYKPIGVVGWSFSVTNNGIITITDIIVTPSNEKVTFHISAYSASGYVHVEKIYFQILYVK